MVERSIMNKVLLLKLLQMSNDGINGKTRLQKLVFDIEAKNRKRGRTDTFNYKFLRWEYGPYSKELQKDIDSLVELGLVNFDGRVYKINSKGLSLLSKAEKFVSNSNKKIIEESLEKYKTIPLQKLLEQIYDEYDVKNFKMGEVMQQLKYQEMGEGNV